jgi:hypothetical protein
MNETQSGISENQPGPKKSFFERISLWIGLLGSAITIILTVWNAQTKARIDKREEDLKALEIQIKERTTGIEESKERVERYKWVLSVFPLLNSRNDNEKTFTLNLVRLALTKDEAEQLFTGLQNSADTSLQSIGQTGITAIQSDPIANLISQMNAAKSDIRKHAVAQMVSDYKSSTQAISLTLRLYEKDKINNLSPSGIINGLYFLGATDPDVWTPSQITEARRIIRILYAAHPGPQTGAEISKLDELIKKLEAGPG